MYFTGCSIIETIKNTDNTELYNQCKIDSWSHFSAEQIEKCTKLAYLLCEKYNPNKALCATQVADTIKWKSLTPSEQQQQKIAEKEKKFEAWFKKKIDKNAVILRSANPIVYKSIIIDCNNNEYITLRGEDYEMFAYLAVKKNGWKYFTSNMLPLYNLGYSYSQNQLNKYKKLADSLFEGTLTKKLESFSFHDMALLYLYIRTTQPYASYKHFSATLILSELFLPKFCVNSSYKFLISNNGL